MMNISKYKKYRDSGLGWLGEIPEEWKIERNKEVFHEVSGRSETGEEMLLTVSHITGVTPRSEKNVNMFLAETMEGYKLCKVGDLLINTMWAWMGALGTSSYEGMCSPAYNVYRPRKWVAYNRRYFDYLYRTPNFIVEMTRFSKGIVSSRLRLYPADFFQIKTVLPPAQVQTAIAKYLDVKTAQIDRKISLLQAKKENYQELRSTIIYKVVTKGLNETVELRDSGIEWIGKIPTHWIIKRGKDALKVKYGVPLDSSLFINDSALGFPMIRIRDLAYNQVRSYYSGEVIKEGIVNNGAVLTGMDGDFQTVIWQGGTAILNQRICEFKATRSIDLGFLYYYLPIALKVINDTKHFTTVKHLSDADLKVIPIACPPLREQMQIAEYLNEKTGKIDTIISTIETNIKVFNELRKTLISDAATGKIKVA